MRPIMRGLYHVYEQDLHQVITVDTEWFEFPMHARLQKISASHGMLGGMVRLVCKPTSARTAVWSSSSTCWTGKPSAIRLRMASCRRHLFSDRGRTPVPKAAGIMCNKVSQKTVELQRRLKQAMVGRQCLARCRSPAYGP